MTETRSAPAGLFARLLPGRSIKRRMVLVFLLLAVALAGVFIVGAQRAFTLGWREAARPVLMDYIDRLAADVVVPVEGPPSVERAQALVQRLPLTVRIEGPTVNWLSHPDQAGPDWAGKRRARERGWDQEQWGGDKDWERMLQRRTADGHVITFGLNEAAFERRQRHFGVALVALLLITLSAYLYVRRLLRPLDDIRAGAQRFGAGEFGQPIPVRHPGRPDELGQLAVTVNTMGHDIHEMLEAKRALLLAISHELRSPITRARLHAELLPEQGEAAAQRQALLGDLQEMANLVSDLLESERLSGNHAVLHREQVDLPALAREVLQELTARHARAVDIVLHAEGDLAAVHADRARLRLLLRNLLDNALRHGGGAPQPPELRLARSASAVLIEVRDHGPGVPDAQLAQLAQAFYRPDSARTRAAGGVGLGLYLCRLVAQAHGGRLVLSNARPGLRVQAELPKG
jgi:signal transduction histidine kinase